MRLVSMEGTRHWSHLRLSRLDTSCFLRKRDASGGITEWLQFGEDLMVGGTPDVVQKRA